MIGFHETEWIEDEKVVREAFTTADGRILGNENVYRRFPIERDGEMVMTWRGGPQDTAQFYSVAEAGAWLDELRCREQVVRVQLAGGTKLVFAS